MTELAAHRFALPLDFAILDEGGTLVRAFSIEKTDKLVMGRSDDVSRSFPSPLTVAATEPGERGRTATMTIGAAQVIGPVIVN